MNNRVFLMILACLAFYLVWLNLGRQFGFVPEPRKPEPPTVEEVVAPPEPEPSVPQQETAPPVAPSSEEEISPQEQQIDAETVTLSNEKMTIDLSNKGGVLRSVTLREFVSSKEEGDPVVLISPHQQAPGEVVFFDGKTSGDWMFHVERPSSNSVVFQQSRNGLTIRKEYQLGDSYDVAVTVAVTQQGQPTTYRFIISEGLRRVRERDVKKKSFLSASAVNPKLLQVDWSRGLSEDSMPTAKVETVDFSSMSGEGALDWVGISDTYFANVFIPKNQFLSFLTKKVAVPLADSPVKTADVPVVALQTDNAMQGTFYLGPKSESDLVPIDSRLENLVSYGWAGLLSKWMYKLLRWFYGFLGNWGWSIIGVTVLIRLALVPISMPSIKSSFKMRKIQPKIDALRKKYPGKDMESRQKLSQETFKLYKEEGVNPFSSCITILPQLPIFIAYFSLLRTSISLRQSEWMFWVNDLSAKDPTFILPILMGVTMYLSQLTMPMPGDPAQQKMMKLMPVFLTLMFLPMPSGLMLYMITSNLFQLGQSYFMKWRYRDL